MLHYKYDSPPRGAIQFAHLFEATTPANAGVVISESRKLRTIAYVDGYNLYHGRLKYTQFKWLDLQGLMASITEVQNPSSELTAVKLFTAHIKARFARRGQQSVVASAGAAGQEEQDAARACALDSGSHSRYRVGSPPTSSPRSDGKETSRQGGALVSTCCWTNCLHPVYAISLPAGSKVRPSKKCSAFRSACGMSTSSCASAER